MLHNSVDVHMVLTRHSPRMPLPLVPPSVYSLYLPPLPPSLSHSHGCHRFHLPFTRPSSEMQMSATILPFSLAALLVLGVFFFLFSPGNPPLLLFQLRFETLVHSSSQSLWSTSAHAGKNRVSLQKVPKLLSTGAPTFASLPHIAKEGKGEKK